MNIRHTGLVLALALSTASLSGCSLIAAPILDAQQDKAVEATAQLDLINAAIAAETYAVSNNGSYPTSSEGLLENGYKPSPGMSDVRILVGGGGISYCLSVTAESGAIFKLLADSSYADGECTDADAY